MGFYDEIAGDYRDMTNFDDRAESLEKNVERLCERYQPKTVLDLACGTGDVAVQFAKRGVGVVAMDQSEEMVQVAQKTAEEAGVKVKFLQGDMQTASDHIGTSFDLILCLGNSLPHLRLQSQLEVFLASCEKLLSPGGTLLIHVLNFIKILTEKERIVSISRKDQKEYIRFYDFFHGKIRFNLLTVDWSDSQPSHTLSSTRLMPYTHDTLERIIYRYDFSPVKFYGDYEFNPYDPAGSQALLIEAKSAG